MNFKKSLLIITFLVLTSFNLPKNIQKKVHKVIKATFEIETFTLDAVTFTEDIIELLPSEFGNENFFKVLNGDKLKGYAYISKAPSKTDHFDYLVVFDEELIIKSSKILVYREDYGGEIGSKRWLKQLIGKTENDVLVYGDNIAAISGATISVRSMTTAVNNLLKSVKILHKKQLL
jgi:Na+-translocating ferredoxin:NAD+ oxidoreductase RnfG subunit